MPYIMTDRRVEIDGGAVPRNPGELNYLFTVIALDYLSGGEESYRLYNDVIGALEACKLELYRRQVALYEDKKLEDNGDVYSL